MSDSEEVKLELIQAILGDTLFEEELLNISKVIVRGDEDSNRSRRRSGRQSGMPQVDRKISPLDVTVVPAAPDISIPPVVQMPEVQQLQLPVETHDSIKLISADISR